MRRGFRSDPYLLKDVLKSLFFFSFFIRKDPSKSLRFTLFVQDGGRIRVSEYPTTEFYKLKGFYFLLERCVNCRIERTSRHSRNSPPPLRVFGLLSVDPILDVFYDRLVERHLPRYGPETTTTKIIHEFCSIIINIFHYKEDTK